MLLKTWLKKTKITVTAFSKLADVDRSYIYTWFRGENVPSDRIMDRIKEITLGMVSKKSDLKK